MTISLTSFFDACLTPSVHRNYPGYPDHSCSLGFPLKKKKEKKKKLLFIWPYHPASRTLGPWLEQKLHLLQWNHRVLTTGPPGNSRAPFCQSYMLLSAPHLAGVLKASGNALTSAQTTPAPSLPPFLASAKSLAQFHPVYWDH